MAITVRVVGPHNSLVSLPPVHAGAYWGFFWLIALLKFLAIILVTTIKWTIIIVIALYRLCRGRPIVVRETYMWHPAHFPSLDMEKAGVVWSPATIHTKADFGDDDEL